MRLNKINGLICIKSTNNPTITIENTIKILQKNKFITDNIENRIIFQRSIQFSTHSSENLHKFFLFSYTGVINIFNNQGNTYFDYSLNINTQLIKLTGLIILSYTLLHLINLNVHPLILLGIFVFIIFSQRVLLKNHFITIIKQKLE